MKAGAFVTFGLALVWGIVCGNVIGKTVNGTLAGIIGGAVIAVGVAYTQRRKA